MHGLHYNMHKLTACLTWQVPCNSFYGLQWARMVQVKVRCIQKIGGGPYNCGPFLTFEFQLKLFATTVGISI